MASATIETGMVSQCEGREEQCNVRSIMPGMSTAMNTLPVVSAAVAPAAAVGSVCDGDASIANILVGMPSESMTFRSCRGEMRT